MSHQEFGAKCERGRKWSKQVETSRNMLLLHFFMLPLLSLLLCVTEIQLNAIDHIQQCEKYEKYEILFTGKTTLFLKGF